MKSLHKYWLPVIVALVLLPVVAAAKPAPSEPKPELPKTGVNLARAKGGWLNIEAVGHRFVVKFYDAKKKQFTPDMTRGLVRYYYTAKAIHPPVPLNRAKDGRALESPNKVKPPHVFHMHVVLLAEGSDEPVESYNFRYPG